MATKQEIRDWQQNIADQYCRDCIDTCCDTSKLILDLDSNTHDVLALFKQHDIPIYRFEELDTKSILNWADSFKKRNKSRIKTVYKTELEQPAIIQHPNIVLFRGRLFFGEFSGYSLYTDSHCPFYKDKQCSVHDDPRRPEGCKEYPLIIGIGDSVIGNINYVKILERCPVFTLPEVRKNFRERFPDIGYHIVR